MRLANDDDDERGASMDHEKFRELAARLVTPKTERAADEAGPPPSVWGLVPPRNPDFVGRADLFRELRGRLHPQDGGPAHPQVLHGPVGVGKTQAVVEYVHAHATDYELVWWIPSEHTTQVRSAYVALAKKLGITATDADTAIAAVLEALRTYAHDRRWLLVFDNADDSSLVRSFLPAGRGHVVITSRNPSWDGLARPLEVDLFTRSESVELLGLRSPGLTQADAEALAEALGDLPLALSQVGSWLSRTGASVPECLELLDVAGTVLLGEGADPEYENSVAAAWNVPLHRLRTDHATALRLLEVCAFFGPAPIPRFLLAGAPRELGFDELTLNAAIRRLTGQSLVKVDRRTQALSLHPLLRVVLRDTVAREDQVAGCSG